MPPLLRGVARTAVVAGTATAVSGRVQRRQEARWAEQAPPQQQYAASPPQAPSGAAPGTAADPVKQLKELGELRDSGVLTEEEFAAQKSKILGA